MAATLPHDPQRSALLVVDVQPDFMPGGPLATQGGDEILEPLAELMASGRFPHIVATQDWHPPGHVSFASSHEGREPFEAVELYGAEQVLWPDHCVQATPGAELHPALPWRHAEAILRKATDPRIDSYSGFRENTAPDGTRPPTGLAGYLRERGLERLYVCGLARDYCVRWTAEDGVAAGFEVHLLWDLTRPVDPADDEPVRRALEGLGVAVVDGA